MAKIIYKTVSIQLVGGQLCLGKMKAEVTIQGLESQIADMMKLSCLPGQNEWKERDEPVAFRVTKRKGKKNTSQSDMEEKEQVCEGIS